MTRKDYELIAGALKANLPKVDHHDASKLCLYQAYVYLRSVANDLAEGFKADNPRFDREKFLKACGVD